jgi:hypothetical protein
MPLPLPSRIRTPRPGPHSRPRLELLEDRRAPAVLTWVGPSGGEWSVGSNWDAGRAPAAAADAVIDTPGVTAVHGQSVLDSVRSINGRGGLVMAAGGLINLTAPSTLGDFTMFRGRFGGPADLTVTGSLTWSGGTLYGTGHTVATGTLDLSNTAIVDGTTLEDHVLDNEGNAFWHGSGTILTRIQSAVNNRPGATFTVEGDAAWTRYNPSDPATFNNAGTLTKTGDGLASLGLAVNNTGRIDVQGGTLELGGGSNSGDITAADTATLAIADSFTSTRPLDLPNLVLSRGTLSVQGDVTVTGTFTWSGGTLTGSGQTSVLGTLALNGTFGGTLSSRNFDAFGDVTWTQGGLTIQGTAVFRSHATFTAQSTGSVGGSGTGRPTFQNLGTFVKTSPGTTPIGAAFDSPGSVDVRAGTLALAGGGTGDGAFAVEAGAVLGFGDPQAGGGGTYTLSADSTVSGPGNVQVTGGTTEVRGGFTAATRVTGGTITFVTDTELPSLFMSGGTAGVRGAAVAVDGLFTWLGGTLNGTGEVLAQGGMAMSGMLFNPFTLDGVTLENLATATWTSPFPLTLRNNAVFNNLPGATFDVETDAAVQVQGTGTFANAGTLRKSVTSGTTNFAPTFVNTGLVDLQSGTLGFTTYTQTDGMTLLEGGALSASSILIEGGSLRGTGTVTGNVTNAGLVQVGGDDLTGVLNIQGNYTQTAAGVLALDLGGLNPGNQFDQLRVSGRATLDGTLRVTLIDGFTPSAGDAFRVLNFASLTGAFANVEADLPFDAAYDGNGLTLVA